MLLKNYDDIIEKLVMSKSCNLKDIAIDFKHCLNDLGNCSSFKVCGYFLKF